jgi:hypothetical protein
MALGGQSQTWFFSSFFAASPRKKKKKGYFWGDCIPQTPALQSGKPLKLTHMPHTPPERLQVYSGTLIAVQLTRGSGIMHAHKM